jgi:mannose/fructose/N-acetylgalactosamine-specific phosphotransferase system component IIB
VPIELYRVDDRLIHGQVVVGWGQPLDIRFIVLVDDVVAASDWEQDLYRMGVPPEMEVVFESVDGAIAHLVAYDSRPGAGIVLTADIGTMRRLVDGVGTIKKVNIGGIHHREGRDAKLRYVFLSADESDALRALAALGVTVTAQDVPATTPVPLDQVLAAVAP